MTLRQFAAALMCASSVQSFATADSIGPLLNSRHVDPTGTYYVVVKRDLALKKPSFSTPVTFEIATRAAGTPPVTPARDFVRYENVGALDLALGVAAETPRTSSSTRSAR